ncbi:hypothetical protein [Clostridium sp. AM58-1XD]|uniref:hypothetical protein n=1 Tax=Clostridium sp. AM58-1XD TaxID=2292307 RepID=UPI000E4736D1|nr:hypothetical protein [Clostridium sp. AM58-1XD]RGZ00461.1 hypothetical protein DXA13_05370 [Clostridium sp. AM58-1XD]
MSIVQVLETRPFVQIKIDFLFHLQMNETCEQMKQHFNDTNKVVKKGTTGIPVKKYPENKQK